MLAEGKNPAGLGEDMAFEGAVITSTHPELVQHVRSACLLTSQTAPADVETRGVTVGKVYRCSHAGLIGISDSDGEQLYTRVRTTAQQQTE